MTDFERLLQTLANGDVEFIVVGGIAANAHGAIRATRDVDVVYARSRQNLERVAVALRRLDPYLRGAPPGLPFRLDTATLAAGLNFTLTTSAGDLDLLGEIAGGGGYADLVSHTRPLDVRRAVSVSRSRHVDSREARRRTARGFEVIRET